jgi:hypothetical protein
MDDTVKVLVITEPVDKVRDTMELVFICLAVNEPVCADRDDRLFPTSELTVA